jgi:hypothetical protein
MSAVWGCGPMDLHEKSVGDAENKAFGIAALQPLLVEIFTISRFNQVFALFDHVRDGVAKLAPDALSQFDAR